MRATLDIPDDLYRRVKARSSMEGRPVRSVAIQLFENWLKEPPAVERRPEVTGADLVAAPWLAISRRYLRPGMSHDFDEIRQAIATGSAAETAGKLTTGKRS